MPKSSIVTIEDILNRHGPKQAPEGPAARAFRELLDGIERKLLSSSS